MNYARSFTKTTYNCKMEFMLHNTTLQESKEMKYKKGKNNYRYPLIDYKAMVHKYLRYRTNQLPIPKKKKYLLQNLLNLTTGL